jgi:hypothetical protein
MDAIVQINPDARTVPHASAQPEQINGGSDKSPIEPPEFVVLGRLARVFSTIGIVKRPRSLKTVGGSAWWPLSHGGRSHSPLRLRGVPACETNPPFLSDSFPLVRVSFSIGVPVVSLDCRERIRNPWGVSSDSFLLRAGLHRKRRRGPAVSLKSDTPMRPAIHAFL